MHREVFHPTENGFTLFEILIAISVFAVVSVVASQLISATLSANKQSGQKTVAVALARETAEALDAMALETWHNLYNLNKGSANHYYPVVSGSKWATSTGDELISANGLQYTRSFYIENVSRNTSGNIVSSGGADDPSTQKATIVVSWQDMGANQLGSVTVSRYFTRSRNATASQTSWITQGQGSNPTSGETANFNDGFSSQDGNLNLSGGIQLSTQ